MTQAILAREPLLWRETQIRDRDTGWLSQHCSMYMFIIAIWVRDVGFHGGRKRKTLTGVPARIRRPSQKFPTLTEHLLCARQGQIQIWRARNLYNFGSPL